MPLWLQALLLFGFWIAFWPFLLWWALREQRQARALRVRSLYPPRIHLRNQAVEARIGRLRRLAARRLHRRARRSTGRALPPR